MASEESKKPGETCVIDPDGDLRFELDGVRLLVSSKALSLASDVFSRMLQSRFKEGLANHQGPGQPSVSLPEDNPEIMKTICWQIHHCNDVMPERMDPSLLLTLAEHCDKYDCSGALKCWATLMIARFERVQTKEEDERKLLVAAYVFDLPGSFTWSSFWIISSQVGPFTGLPGVSDHPLIPSIAGIAASATS